MRGYTILLLILTAAAAWSQDTSARDDQGELTPIGVEAATPAEGDAGQIPLVSTWDFLRMVLVLGAVVACIYIIFRLLKRGRNRGLPEHDLIRVVDSRNLSGGKSLHLVQVGRSFFLVGSSDGSVSLVSEISDPESADMVRLSVANKGSESRRSFSDLLSGMFRASPAAGGPAPESSAGGRPDADTPAVSTGASEFVRKQRERLRWL